MGDGNRRHEVALANALENIIASGAGAVGGLVGGHGNSSANALNGAAAASAIEQYNLDASGAMSALVEHYQAIAEHGLETSRSWGSIGRQAGYAAGAVAGAAEGGVAGSLGEPGGGTVVGAAAGAASEGWATGKSWGLLGSILGFSAGAGEEAYHIITNTSGEEADQASSQPRNDTATSSDHAQGSGSSGGGGEPPEDDEEKKHNAYIPEKRAHKIFGTRKGHIEDTEENRSLLQGAVRKENYLGNNRFGNQWYGQTREDGTQVWAEVRNGHIINGGVNETPHEFNPITGLSRLTKPVGKNRVGK